jgi:hypothetical protein
MLAARRSIAQDDVPGREIVMKIVACTCRAAGKRVAIVAVQKSVLDAGSEADRYIMHLSTAFPDAEIVLYGDDGSGKGKYYGRGDLIEALGTISPNDLPWQEVEVDL